MKRTIIALAIAMLATIAASAQINYEQRYGHQQRRQQQSAAAYEQPQPSRWSMHMHLGGIGNTVTGDGSRDATMRFGFTGGLDLDYRLGQIFSISLGGAFSMRGMNYDYTRQSSPHYALNYVDIPLMLNFHLGQRWTLGIGFQPSILVSSKETRLTGRSVDAGDVFQSWDMFMPLAITYETPCGLTLGLRMEFGATDILDTGGYHDDDDYYYDAPRHKASAPRKAYYYDDYYDDYYYYDDDDYFDDGLHNFSISLNVGYKFSL